METLLNTEQVAEQLGLAPITLRKWRVEGFGPKFVRCGSNVRYLSADVAAWIAANTVCSTSAPRA
jgi:predicted DNA-binding transcriptional regulator AlpA